MLILGLNAWHADASAVLLRDGQVVLAAEESRFTRVKHTAGFPEFAVRACLAAGGATLEDLDHIAVASNPDVNLEEDVYYILTGRPNYSGLIRARLANAARRRDVADELARRLDHPAEQIRARVHPVEHTLAHLAGAYHAAAVPEAALLAVGGFGDFCSTMTGAGRGAEVVVLEKTLFPHSLGLLVTAVTQHLGFHQFGDEGKVMGLAAYGRPTKIGAMRRLVRTREHGILKLDVEYFTHAEQGVEMVWDDLRPHMAPLFSWKFTETFGPARRPDEPIEDRHRDLAASTQTLVEELICEVATHLRRAVPADTLCYTGTLAQNAVANAALVRRGPFKRVMIPPAASDAGTALGAALLIHAQVAGAPAPAVAGPYLGPQYADNDIAMAIRRLGVSGEPVADPAAAAAELLAAGKVIGWFQGRMEWGPRALGNRSILADPRQGALRDAVTRGVKMRSPFRPFAASIPAERAADWFVDPVPSPYMELVLTARPERRAAIPAVVHADGSVRVQTVERAANPRFHALLTAFGQRTDVPVLLHTSFNADEPMVCTPDDALRCFRETRLDACVIGDRVVKR